MNAADKGRGEKTRQNIYDFIVQYITEHCYPPSYREIADGVGLKSTNTIFKHISVMINDGVLETDTGIGCPRALRVPGYGFKKQ